MEEVVFDGVGGVTTPDGWVVALLVGSPPVPVTFVDGCGSVVGSPTGTVLLFRGCSPIVLGVLF